MDTPDCPPETETDTIYLSEDTPLVGFHGKVDLLGMTQLGLIFVDTMDPVCKRTSSVDDANMWIYEAMDDEFTAAQESESSLTGNERARAATLEAILMDKTLHSAK